VVGERGRDDERQGRLAGGGDGEFELRQRVRVKRRAGEAGDRLPAARVACLGRGDLALGERPRLVVAAERGQRAHAQDVVVLADADRPAPRTVRGLLQVELLERLLSAPLAEQQPRLDGEQADDRAGRARDG
jgi:hypothetical protein